MSKKIKATKEKSKAALNKIRPILHGENVLVPVSKVPEAAKTITTSSYIVGHSETGHHHVLEAEKQSPFDIIIDGDQMYISSRFESSLVHKKTHDIHETVKVKPGLYKVNRKTEYSPFDRIIRNVWD